MKIFKLEYLFIISMISLITSCTPKFYIPNHNPIPLFKEKSELYIDVSTNLATKGNITLGSSITNELAIYAGINGAYQNSRSYYHEYNESKFSDQMANFGIGYYLNSKKSSRFRFEFFGDYAFGSFKIEDYNKDLHYQTFQNYTGNFERIGILVNMGSVNKKGNFSYGYSARISELDFYNTNYTDDNYWQESIKKMNYGSSYQVIDHSIFGKFGKENVKFKIQFGIHQCLNTQFNLGAVQQTSTSLLFGLIINTSAFKK